MMALRGINRACRKGGLKLNQLDRFDLKRVARLSSRRSVGRTAVTRRRRGAWVKGPKTVNHPHQLGLGELQSMASTRLRSEVGGQIGLTRNGAAVWRP